MTSALRNTDSMVKFKRKEGGAIKTVKGRGYERQHGKIHLPHCLPAFYPWFLTPRIFLRQDSSSTYRNAHAGKYVHLTPKGLILQKQMRILLIRTVSWRGLINKC